MEIYHKFHISMTCHEISYGFALWLGESCFARVEFEAWVGCTLIHFSGKSPIDAVVSVQINSCFLGAATFTLSHVWVAVLSLVNDVGPLITCSRILMEIFDLRETIDVYYRDEVKLILG